MKKSLSESAIKLNYHAPKLRAYGSITKLTLNANAQVATNPDDGNKGNEKKNSAIN